MNRHYLSETEPIHLGSSIPRDASSVKTIKQFNNQQFNIK